VLNGDLAGDVDDDGLVFEEGGYEEHVVLRVQLGDEDGRLEADGAHPRAIVEVPQHDLPVLAGAEQVAVVGGPAQRLHLARVAAQLARNAVGLDVEDDDNAIVLWSCQSHGAGAGEKGAYTARGEQVAAVAEADRRRMAAACEG
jgi:hypothetical protein